MSPLLQFIDAHANDPFKHILSERWADMIANGTLEFTK